MPYRKQFHILEESKSVKLKRNEDWLLINSTRNLLHLKFRKYNRPAAKNFFGSVTISVSCLENTISDCFFYCRIIWACAAKRKGDKFGCNSYRRMSQFPDTHTHTHTHKHTSLTFRHRASCILEQAFRYTPENAFYIFNQQIYFII